MILREILQKRLDDVWSRLQQVESMRRKHAIRLRQIDLDEACIERLEQTVGYLEAEIKNVK